MHVPTRRFLLPLLALVLSISACSREPDEQQIQHALETIIGGIEQKDRSAVLERLSPDFSTRHGQDRDAIEKLLTLHFLRRNQIGVTLIQQQTEVDPLYPDRARSQGQVLLTGADRWLPHEGRLLRVEAQWRREERDWLLYRLHWE